jgi:heme o synthase
MSRFFATNKPTQLASTSTSASPVEVEKKEPSLLSSYSVLAKAKLSALVVSTTAAGYVAAGGCGDAILSSTFASCIVGTALCSGSAAAWNQILEVDRDKLMKRTANRPLVTGALTLPAAQTAAVGWGIAGTGILAVGTDPLTTALGVGNIALYAGLYTYLKPRSVTNTWVGAVVGAIPPVMGWTAATAGASLHNIETAILLGSTLYLWQLPHFFALSFMHRADYARGGFQMIPCLETDGTRTAQIVVRYTWYLSTIPLLATVMNVTSSMFALEGILLNAYALTVAHRFQRDRTNANARKVFLTSLWYLPSLLGLFLLHSKFWDQLEEQDDVVYRLLRDSIHRIRNKGRESCWRARTPE